MSYLTHLELLKAFGEPNLERGMVLWDVPTELEIGVIPKKIYCNKAMVKPLEAAIRNLVTRGYISELKTYNGVFNIRNIRGRQTPSLHSYGCAIDLNAAWNQLGKPSTFTAGFVKCFTDVGFNWGGNFKSRLDCQHYELSLETFLSEMERLRTNK